MPYPPNPATTVRMSAVWSEQHPSSYGPSDVQVRRARRVLSPHTSNSDEIWTAEGPLRERSVWLDVALGLGLVSFLIFTVWVSLP